MDPMGPMDGTIRPVDCILTRIRILTQDRFFCPDARIQLVILSRQKVVSRQKVLSRQKAVPRRKCILEKVHMVVYDDHT